MELLHPAQAEAARSVSIDRRPWTRSTLGAIVGHVAAVVCYAGYGKGTG